MLEPRTYAWLSPGLIAVGERPGGGGRSHRRARRDAELEWWAAAGIATIVSGMRTRHGLLDAALAGFRVRWHPLVGPEQAARELGALVATVIGAADSGSGGVLVHVDRPGEWLTGVDAALRMALGRARTPGEALAQARDDGLPVGDLATGLLRGVAGRRRAASPGRSRRPARADRV